MLWAIARVDTADKRKPPKEPAPKNTEAQKNFGKRQKDRYPIKDNKRTEKGHEKYNGSTKKVPQKYIKSACKVPAKYHKRTLKRGPRQNQRAGL